MITLYHAPMSRSCRVRWLLEELGLPYRVVALNMQGGDLKKPEYLAKNPLGTVPTIEDDGTTLFESGAIIEYLIERYGKGRLAPAPGSPDRPAYLQWLHWAEATALPPLSDIAQHTFLRPESERIAAIVPDARARSARVFTALDAALAGREYLVGGSFSGADVMMGYSVHLGKLLGALPPACKNASGYLEHLSARPAFHRAFGT